MSLFDMLQRYAFGFYEVVVRIERFRNDARSMAALYSYSGPSKVPSFTRDELLVCLDEMRTECKTLELTNSLDLISFATSEIHRKGDDYTYADTLKELDALNFTFAAELSRRSCFRIAAEKAKYFEKDDLFGSDVAAAFGSCFAEIQAAGTCYALEQNEASAFHAMRVLERGLSVLASKFGVDPTNKNWQNVIEEVEKCIRKIDSKFGADWKEQQKFCSQAATHFMFLKDAWRNHIMHVRDVPYDDGRALSVLDHVRQFMQALAEGGLKE